MYNLVTAVLKQDFTHTLDTKAAAELVWTGPISVHNYFSLAETITFLPEDSKQDVSFPCSATVSVSDRCLYVQT